jgi:hypothetical protein
MRYLTLGTTGMAQMRRLFILLELALSIATPVAAIAGNPNCSGTDNWATDMAFVHLKNAGLIHNEVTDFTKTRTVRIASEMIGKDLYRQVHDITFTEKSGNTIEVITVNDASHQECSMSGVQVYVISRKLGGLKG